MKVRLYPFLTICAILLLLVVTQAINGTLSLLSFDQQHLDTTISGYDVVGGDISAKIERALRLGKPLENFIGIEKLLAQGMAVSSDLENVSVIDKSGNSLYTLNAEARLPAELQVEIGAENRPSSHLQYGEDHFLLYDIRGNGKEIAGYLVLNFNNQHLRQRRGTIIHMSLMVLGGCTLLAALILATGFSAVFHFPGLQRRRIIALFLFVVLGGAQLICSVYNIFLFQENYLEITRTKSHTVARLLKQDVEYLLQKGLKLTTLINLEAQLNTSVAKTVELAWLIIEDDQGERLYQGGEVTNLSGEFVERFSLQVLDKKVGSITVGLNSSVIRDVVREIAFDSLTVVALSLLIVMEFVIFLFATLLRPLVEQEANIRRYASRDQLMRTTIFLSIFGSSLCYSFIPLYMDQISQPVWGFSREMLLGMPLAVEMLAGGLVLIPAGYWIDRRGWHQPFLLGTVLSCVGMLCSGLASGPVAFIAARALTGVGYGLAWMSAQGYVLLNSDIKHRALAISNVVAGIYGGLICGNAIGALIAHRLGFRDVFFIAGIMLLLLLGFVILFMRHSFTTPESKQVVKKGKGIGVAKMLLDPQILLIFTCSLLPYSIVAVGLLYYVTPLYLVELGARQSDIGRVIMLFGLCMIFVAPHVSRFADKLEDKRILVLAGGLLGSCSLLLFFLSESFWIVPLSVVLFGLSVSISAASRNVIVLALPVAEKMGVSKVMGVYRSVDKLGQTLGALIPASLITFMDIRSAMVVMGVVYLGLTALLMLRLSRSKLVQAVTDTG